MSKQSKPIGTGKRPRKVPYYLDRNLCSDDTIDPLRAAGFRLTTYWDDYGRVIRQSIPDPSIIAVCGERKQVLITSDGRLEYTYAIDILNAGIGVVLLVRNNDGARSWARRLIAAKETIEEKLAAHRKPLLIRVALDGTLTQIRLYRKKGSRVISVH